MPRWWFHISMAMAATALLAACLRQPQPEDGADAFNPEYLAVTTSLLDDDLVNFNVRMRGARDSRDVSSYAECAAAQYALIRGYGFARHLRTQVSNEGGTWVGDAVYTISSDIPDGLRRIDAEVTVENCIANGIPTV